MFSIISPVDSHQNCKTSPPKIRNPSSKTLNLKNKFHISRALDLSPERTIQKIHEKELETYEKLKNLQDKLLKTINEVNNLRKTSTEYIYTQDTFNNYEISAIKIIKEITPGFTPDSTLSETKNLKNLYRLFEGIHKTIIEDSTITAELKNWHVERIDFIGIVIQYRINKIQTTNNKKGKGSIIQSLSDNKFFEEKKKSLEISKEFSLKTINKLIDELKGQLWLGFDGVEDDRHKFRRMNLNINKLALKIKDSYLKLDNALTNVKKELCKNLTPWKNSFYSNPEDREFIKFINESKILHHQRSMKTYENDAGQYIELLKAKYASHRKNVYKIIEEVLNKEIKNKIGDGIEIWKKHFRDYASSYVDYFEEYIDLTTIVGGKDGREDREADLIETYKSLKTDIEQKRKELNEYLEGLNKTGKEMTLAFDKPKKEKEIEELERKLEVNKRELEKVLNSSYKRKNLKGNFEENNNKNIKEFAESVKDSFKIERNYELHLELRNQIWDLVLEFQPNREDMRSVKKDVEVFRDRAKTDGEVYQDVMKKIDDNEKNFEWIKHC